MLRDYVWLKPRKNSKHYRSALVAIASFPHGSRAWLIYYGPDYEHQSLAVQTVEMDRMIQKLRVEPPAKFTGKENFEGVLQEVDKLHVADR